MGERDSDREKAANTSTTEIEGLKALQELGRVIQRLWEVGEREGEVSVSVVEMAKLVDLHRTVSRSFTKANSIDKRLGAIEKQVMTLAKRIPTVTKPTWGMVTAAAPVMTSLGRVMTPPSKSNAITIRPPIGEGGEYNGRSPATAQQ